MGSEKYLNAHLSIREIEFLINNFPQKKTLRTDIFQC